ncbi:MAG: sigma-54 dependent transcriptional regulator [Spirochaetales bacterium]|nr:sigma-54 dependent transcriptional regulator [Spirochaetales bacterium]MCF7938293.1 sigma-54 dependent transcriptional regulator [Spirochaetales bacterium]
MSDQFKILVVDDDPEVLRTVKRLFRSSQYGIFGVQSGKESLEYLEKNTVHALILDMRLPDIKGINLLETIKMKYFHIDVLILTGYGTIQDAVKATQIGASDFIEKEYLREKLPKRVNQLYRFWQLDRENARLSEQLGFSSKNRALIGNSMVMLSLKESISRVAKTDSSVLIMGETGTGKELVAREIHRQSSRAEKNFIAVDCAAINDSTFESEMFGHVKGAFTGAQASHDGLIRAANGGTLFFDEIGELPPPAQSKLLRSIQEREVRPVGSTKTRTVDVRVLAATNRNLEEEVQNGKFREDLFYRLNVIALQVPPLRKRDEDIILLFRYFLAQFSLADTLPYIENGVFESLGSYSWPGNVRELQNVAGHVIAFCQNNKISRSDLPEKLHRGEFEGMQGTTAPALTLEDQEKKVIEIALESNGGNRRKAAEQLGIGVATLYRKLKKYHTSQ